MMAPPTAIMMRACRTQTTRPSRQRARRNAMADVTTGITADQLQALEAKVQTYIPDFFNPSTATSAASDGLMGRRRNAVPNVVEGLSHHDLHHLEDLVQTTYNDTDFEPSGDGEDACFSPTSIFPSPAYYERRRNALATPLDPETLQRMQSLHNCRNRSTHPA